MLRPILDFVYKQGRKGAELLKKLKFLLLFSLIRCKLKKSYTFPRHVDTDNKISMNLNAFKESNLVGDGFFS
jgi:hypothetical protein